MPIPFILKTKTEIKMKIIITLITALVLASCTTIEYPDGTVIRTVDRGTVNDLLLPIIVDGDK